MLTYVATLCLSALVYGPLKDPLCFYVPQSRMFGDAALLPILLDGTRMHLGTLVALAVAVAGWVLMSFTIIGFQLRVLGQAPAGALRRLQCGAHGVALSAAERRARRPRRPLRGRRADRAARPVDLARLWLPRHHRRLPRPPAPARHCPRRPAGGALLPRRRDRDCGRVPAAGG